MNQARIYSVTLMLGDDHEEQLLGPVHGIAFALLTGVPLGIGFAPLGIGPALEAKAGIVQAGVLPFHGFDHAVDRNGFVDFHFSFPFP
jgi:hypothetical protein